MSGSHRRVAIPHSRAPLGTCRWCGEQVFRRGTDEPDPRRNWHSGNGERDCVAEYRATWPDAWRKRVYERDQGICAECPDGSGPHRVWDADHIVPLIDGGDWAMENAQTLCRPHHKAKTAGEATIRAARRASGGQLSLAGDRGLGPYGRDGDA